MDAAVTGELLTITKYDGSTVSVDFSVYATDEALNLLAGRVSTLEGTVATHGENISDLQGRMTTVEGKASAAEGKLAGLTGTVAEDIAAAVKVEKERAEAAEEALGERIDPLATASSDHEGRIAELEGLFTGTEGGSVQDLIDSAIEKNNTDVVTPGLAAKADKATYEAYVAANDERVAAAEKEIDDEVLRATAAEAGLQEQLGSGFSKDATVAAAVKDAADAAAAAQKTIDGNPNERKNNGAVALSPTKRRTVHARKVLNGSLLSCIIKSPKITNRKARILYHNERQKSTGITDGIGNKNCRERSGTEIGGNLRGTGLHRTIQEICAKMAEGQSGNLI